MGDIVRQHPWSTVIWTVNLSEKVDLDAIAEAILMAPSGEDISDSVQPELEILRTLQEEHIRPALANYLLAEYGAKLDDHSYYFQHFGLSVTDGRGVEPHQHSFSTLSSVFYPVSSKAPLIIMDPRGGAGRGIPKSIRDRQFANFRHQPQAGELLIFPAHLTHCVGAHAPELRLSLVTDLVVEEKWN